MCISFNLHCVCVCVCVGVGGWVGGWVCVCACVCVLHAQSYHVVCRFPWPGTAVHGMDTEEKSRKSDSNQAHDR